MPTNKSLGQHWLKDPAILSSIADSITLNKQDQVLEIGPGLGTLTSKLLSRAGSVVAVEFDYSLARKLKGQFPGKNLAVISGDILTFDLSKLDKNYKVVANIPYYITSKIVQKLSESDNPPQEIAILVQKEVAIRLASGAGEYSISAIAAQIFYEVKLGIIVTADKFTPPPKVDSQMVVMRRLDNPLVEYADRKAFFRLVKAGFSAKRKKLKSSLSGGLHLDKKMTEKLLEENNISSDKRAEDLTIDQWLRLTKIMQKQNLL